MTQNETDTIRIPAEKPDYQLAAEEFAALIAPMNLKFTAEPVDKSPWSDPKDWPKAKHFRCTIERSGGAASAFTIESYYSVGSGACLPSTKREALDLWRKVSVNVRLDSFASGDSIWKAVEKAKGGGRGLTIWEDAIAEGFRAKYRPSLTDVLGSLIRDAVDPAETFEDWASNYGYEPDSIKAHKTWEVCCDFYRKLVRAFGREQLERMQEIVNRF